MTKAPISAASPIPTPEPITETDKLRKEWSFREGEMALKEKELEIKEQEREDNLREIAIKENEYNRSRWNNPLVVAIFAASLAATGNAVVAYFNANAQRAADRNKASDESIL